MIKEYDNIKIEALDILLNEKTTLQKFYNLIPIKTTIINSLHSINIYDKYEFLNADKDEIFKLLNVDIQTFYNLYMFFHTYNFIDRKLSDLKHIDSPFIQNLKNDNIKNSSEYFKTIKELGLLSFQKKYNISLEIIKKIWCLCDLMRLPGVKITRSELYFDCGYTSVKAFSYESPENMLITIKNYINKNISNKAKITPLPKEISTQIAIAKSIPHLILD
ncbi:DUF4332 domain-containing protein [Fusobacterium sp.]|uniref:DUF4332 domain-containing protein n=1 Tax=Fusobacterium sp. TaxID=68766 RepID=UPI002903D46F|nr:DUF4332 domain-containing protein [Fusobacterium sp.]MDU1911503.1 DUF4332 domain-containing protein [Fusobacterium sp.]